MSVILGVYKSKRKLGKGAYGDVMLAEDSTGKQIAIKMISKRALNKQPYLQQYLDGEKECMMSVKSRYVMELYDVQEDDNYVYFICEFCEGGDLLNYQAKQQKKVFSLANTTKILSQVINGLYQLHQREYLHRDIKPQNILLKKDSIGGFEFKLADFGFAKKTQDVGGTVLGTEHYMSPEVYSNQVYSFQVDMWAFGVLMYFMLNMQFPFKINPHFTIQQKQQQLTNQSKNFSYGETVKKSKKKIEENINPQTEDLFKRMFEPNGEKRITFAEIREHPLFKSYFYVDQGKSKIIYGNKGPDKLTSFIQYKMSGIHPQTKKLKEQQAQNAAKKQQKKEEQQNITPSVCFKKNKTTEEKQIVEHEREKINFLYEAEEELSLNLSFLDPLQIIALRYNLLKYYYILLRDFYNGLKPEVYEKNYPNKKWKQFFKTNDFNSIKQDIKNTLDQIQMKINSTYDQCRSSLEDIEKYNNLIKNTLQAEVSQNEFEGDFKNCYRTSTAGVFQKVRTKFSNGNRYSYLTLLITICHCFNHIVGETEGQLQNIFAQYTKEKKCKLIDFSDLKSWMSTSSKEQLKVVLKIILKKYLS